MSVGGEEMQKKNLYWIFTWKNYSDDEKLEQKSINLLDEIDKIGNDYRGDPSSAL